MFCRGMVSRALRGDFVTTFAFLLFFYVGFLTFSVDSMNYKTFSFFPYLIGSFNFFVVLYHIVIVFH